MSHEMTIVFHDTGEDGYVAECLEIPGCLAQGETEAEAIENIQDAIRSCLLVLLEDALADVTAHRDLGGITYTDIAKQTRIRMTPQISTEAEAMA